MSGGTIETSSMMSAPKHSMTGIKARVTCGVRQLYWFCGETFLGTGRGPPPPRPHGSRVGRGDVADDLKQGEGFEFVRRDRADDELDAGCLGEDLEADGC
jgi:hypothetical protein